MKNADTPAMPATVKEEFELTGCRSMNNGEKQKSVVDVSFPGLTKREMFAMHFMASLTKTYWENDCEYESGDVLVKCQAETAIEMADALLSELEKTND